MIKLVWHCHRDTAWESDWLEFLFADIPHTTVVDYGQTIKEDHCVFIFNSSIKNLAYLEQLREEGYSFGLIHLSDEWSKDSLDCYAPAKFVLRNYYKELDPKVLNFPLGWMSGFTHDLEIKTVDERKYTWAFSGHIDKTTRPQMARWMATVPDGLSFFKRAGEYHGYKLTPAEMSDVFNNSIFVPCPMGNCSIDSFRVTEALQAGSLPIVERNPYWEQLYGNNPLLQIDDWSDAPELIKQLMTDLEKLETLRQSTHRWWIQHCSDLKLKIKDLCESS